MLIEEAIRAHLIANGGVSTQVGNRVFPDTLPQDPVYPAIRYLKVSGFRHHSHGGASGVAEPRMQLDCVAKTKAQVKGLADAVRLALDGFSGTMGGGSGVEVDGAFLEDERDEYDDELQVYWCSLDFLIVHAEARS